MADDFNSSRSSNVENNEDVSFKNELQNLGLYEKGMSIQQMQEIMKVINDSKETAEKEDRARAEKTNVVVKLHDILKDKNVSAAINIPETPECSQESDSTEIFENTEVPELDGSPSLSQLNVPNFNKRDGDCIIISSDESKEIIPSSLEIGEDDLIITLESQLNNYKKKHIVPYFAPIGVCPKKYTEVILDDINLFFTLLRKLQDSSKQFIEWGSPVIAGRHFPGTLDNYFGPRKYLLRKQHPFRGEDGDLSDDEVSSGNEFSEPKQMPRLSSSYRNRRQMGSQTMEIKQMSDDDENQQENSVANNNNKARQILDIHRQNVNGRSSSGVVFKQNKKNELVSSGSPEHVNACFDLLELEMSPINKTNNNSTNKNSKTIFSNIVDNSKNSTQIPKNYERSKSHPPVRSSSRGSFNKSEIDKNENEGDGQWLRSKRMVSLSLKRNRQMDSSEGQSCPKRNLKNQHTNCEMPSITNFYKKSPHSNLEHRINRINKLQDTNKEDANKINSSEEINEFDDSPSSPNTIKKNSTIIINNINGQDAEEDYGLETIYEKNKSTIEVKCIECPICGRTFAENVVEGHASECTGVIELPTISTRGSVRRKLSHDVPRGQRSIRNTIDGDEARNNSQLLLAQIEEIDDEEEENNSVKNVKLKHLDGPVAVVEEEEEEEPPAKVSKGKSSKSNSFFKGLEQQNRSVHLWDTSSQEY